MNLCMNSNMVGKQPNKKFISVSKQSSSSKEPSAAKIKFELPPTNEINDLPIAKESKFVTG